MGVRTGGSPLPGGPPGSRDGPSGGTNGGSTVTDDLHGLGMEQRRTALQVKMQQQQQRRPWENLEQQCLTPPLRMASAIRNLDRARTEDFLKHKIWNRPDRKELVKKHILEDTQAQPALQAAQLRLKRARLAADLSGRLAARPGPIELVQRRILAVDGAGLPRAAGSPHLAEEEARSLSPDSPSPPPRGPSPCPQGPSPPPRAPPLHVSGLRPEASSPADLGPQEHREQRCGQHGDSASALGVSGEPLHPRQGHPSGVTAATKPRSPLVKHTQPHTESASGQRARSRGKDPRPKVRKLKYHQYIPPGQRPSPDKGPSVSSVFSVSASSSAAPRPAETAHGPGRGPPEAPGGGQARGPPLLQASATPYTRLLQQQQMFLELQTLGHRRPQQAPDGPQRHEGRPRLLPLQAGPRAPASSPTLAAVKSEPRPGASDESPAAGAWAGPARRPPGGLPTNLDDMKVTELRHELKRRSLPVSGTKPALLERLRRSFSAAAAAEGPAAASVAEPPSPPPAVERPDPGEASPPQGPRGSPRDGARSPAVKEEERTASPPGPDAGDRLLLEMKRRKIEELQRLLEREQRQADELRRQIAREKGLAPRSPGSGAARDSPGSVPSPRAPAGSEGHVKQEPGSGGGVGVPAGPEAEAGGRGPVPRSPPQTPPAPLLVKREWPPDELAELCKGPPAPATGPAETALSLQLDAPGLQPSYEDAVKQKSPSMQGGLDQHMDDLLDILIENGEIPASAREQDEPRASSPEGPAAGAPCGPPPAGGHLGLGAFRLSVSTAPSPCSPASEAQLAASLGVVIGVCGGGEAAWADDAAFWADAEAGAGGGGGRGGSESGASERDGDDVDWTELARGLAPLGPAPPAGPFSSADLFADAVGAGGGGGNGAKELAFGAASQMF